MPVGNSITDGRYGSSDGLGFRNDLYARLRDAGLSFDFVGGTGTPPYEGYFFPGARIEELYIGGFGTGARDIAPDMNNYAPEYILLHIGTNNISNTETAAPYSNDRGQTFLNTASGKLAELLAYLARWKTGAYGSSLKKIVLCKIIPKVAYPDQIALFNQEVAKIVTDSEQGRIPTIPAGTLYLVDQYSPFDVATMMSADGIHPNDVGYSKMADVYFNALASILLPGDNFNRTSLGPYWTADPEYRIVNNELANTSSDNVWGHLAVYNLASNANDVSFQWGAAAPQEGIDQGGFALLLNAASVNADGYLLFRRTNGTISLWTIAGGVPGHSVASATGSQSAPRAGDVMRVLVSTSPAGHHFDLYINGRYDGRVTDTAKEKGNSANKYAGIMLKGGYNTSIDNFFARTTLDVTPPAAITNLGIAGLSSMAVTLTWTAPGDDGNVGTASSYVIKYLDQPITAANFASAVTVLNPPVPKAAGSVETYEVKGLLSNKTYFFAIKAVDEAGNVSDLSNIVSAVTPGQATLATFTDDFERESLGANWSAHSAYAIVNGDLANTSPTYAWGYMAVLNNRDNPEEASIKWANNADATGIREGGLALMLNAPMPTASGYLVWKDGKYVRLWTVTYGNPGQTVANVEGLLPQPGPGDVFKVKMSTSVSGHHFDVFINDQFDARVSDTNKLQGNATTKYAGVYLKGGLNNNVAEFSVAVPLGDPSILVVAAGNQQGGPVGTRLPVPLTAQVTDRNGYPVSGVYVDFKLASGQGFLSTDSVSFNGYIWMEAEEGIVTPPMVKAFDPNASGGAYVHVPDGTGANAGKVTFTVYLPVSGTFYLWGRGLGPSGTSDSFWSYADDGTAEIFSLQSQTTWGWRRRTTPLALSAGVHTIVFENREDGTLLDKILLTNVSTFTPSGLGGITPPLTNVSNTSGFAYSYLTLGTQAGQVTVNATASYKGTPLSGSPAQFVAYATSSTPTPLRYVSGNGQTGPAGQPLPAPFVVEARDSYNNPVVNLPVLFEVVEGEGRLSEAQPVFTGANGRAATVLTLGTTQFKNVVRASSPGVSGAPVEFTAYATSGIPTEIQYVSGNYQTGVVGSQLAQPLVVRVLDNLGDPRPGWPVVFRIQTGDGALDGGIDSLSVFTSQEGLAQAVWTLGTKAGIANNIVAAVATHGDSLLAGAPVLFQASASAAAPHGLQMISGDHQSAPIGWELDQPLSVLVVDRFGNPVTGCKVRFEVTVGTASFAGSTFLEVTTDQNGIAQAVLTMGNIPGQENRVEVRGASQALVGEPVGFRATATEGVASHIYKISGDQQTATVGTLLPRPLVVQVKDIFGNVRPGHTVHFTVTAGDARIAGATSSDVVTDQQGLAQVNVTVGTTAGANLYSIAASSQDIRGRPLVGSPVLFTASATPGAPAQLAKISGDGQSAPVNTALEQPLKVRVTDQYGNGVSGVNVLFQVLSGAGSIEGVRQKTVPVNSQGYAQVVLTLGSVAGTDNVVQASVTIAGQHLAGSPVTFRATALPGAAAGLVRVSGNNQTGKAGSRLPQPFVVRVRDQWDNPVPNFPVRFTVAAGGGNIDSLSFKDVLTDSTGQARAYLTLGTVAGTFNHKVTVTGQGLSGSVDFFASATADNPHRLVQVSGDGQTAMAGTRLTSPFVVRVVDRFDNPIAAHSVIFTVLQGGGTIDGVAERTVATNATGYTQVFLTLGTAPGSQVVQARASYAGTNLQGSPAVFTATATGAPPARMAQHSGNGQVGVVGNFLSMPVKVLVTDQYGYPVPGHTVTFSVVSGGGALGPAQAATAAVVTDAVGIAQMTWRLGPEAGIDNNVVHATATYQGVALTGSPVVFTASARTSAARTILIESGNNQIGVVGRPLPGALRVKAVDADSSPVAGHPATFRVISGGGKLNGNDTTAVRTTGSDGIAEVTLTLGPRTGTANNVVQATATDGLNPLAGSPLSFIASALPDVPSSSASSVTATSPVPADGVSQSLITVTLRDTFNNPVPGRVVSILASGSGNTLTQPSAPTDAQGRATAALASTKAGQKTVRARVENDNVLLADSAIVTFTPLSASKIAYHDGNNQVANVGTAASKPLAVLVTDRNDNPVSGHQVQFVVISGGGRIVEVQPIATNGDGIARATLVVGRNPGSNVVDVYALGLSGSPVRFQCQGVIPVPSTLLKLAGDNQTGPVNAALPDPFKVKVLDTQGRPVWGAPVTFACTTSPAGEWLTQVPDTSDEYGVAQASYRLSTRAGVNSIRASTPGVSTWVAFTATGIAGQAAKLTQEPFPTEGTVGQVLLGPLRVRVTDTYANPVAGFPVEFSVVSDQGAVLNQQPSISDTSGIASATVILGTTAGSNIFKALAPGLSGSPVYFVVNGEAGPAASMAKHAGDAQIGTPGMPLPSPLQVILKDRYGNPVPNTTVNFVAATGGGSFVEEQPVRSDQQGIAAARWVLGSALGMQTAWAVKAGVSGSPLVFQATAVANAFPIITFVGDTVRYEAEPVMVRVQVSDLDGDPVTLNVTGLPPGATFDPATGVLSWQPTYEQAGTYPITFTAQDNKGATTTRVLTLVILNKNRLPVIVAFSPPEKQLSLEQGQTRRFSISARDPDGDPLHFLWKVNGTTAGYDTTYLLVAAQWFPGHYAVTAYVFDDSDTTSESWSVDIRTAVELVAFSAQVVPYQGVTISWKTAYEVGNVGFQILRSVTVAGPYEALNSELVPPRPDRTYSFADVTAKVGQTYHYRLADVDAMGRTTLHPPLTVVVPVPAQYKLCQNFPNPFNPVTTLRYELPKCEAVRLLVFDVMGRVVRTLVDRQQEPGYHTVTWDGRNEVGQSVGSGVYYVRLEAGDFRAVVKMALVR
jgi:protocatechuate 3,4-dioxygenase beta subunit